MNPGAFLLLALGISAVGTLLLWARSRPRRLHMNDSIAGFKRELAALSPDRSPDALVREHSRLRSEPSVQEPLHADEARWQEDDTDLEPVHHEQLYADDAAAADIDAYEPFADEGEPFDDVDLAHDEPVEEARTAPAISEWVAVDDDREASHEPRGYLDELYGAADRET